MAQLRYAVTTELLNDDEETLLSVTEQSATAEWSWILEHTKKYVDFAEEANTVKTVTIKVMSR